jgi:protein gp37
LSEVAGEPHIWWGVSVEDRKYGLPRIADLQSAPAAVRFLSVEPLLEDVGSLPLEGISWVIGGGESGPGARPMQEAWVLSIREQCKAAGVAFFSSSGAACARKRRAGPCGAAHMMQFPNGSRTRRYRHSCGCNTPWQSKAVS